MKNAFDFLSIEKRLTALVSGGFKFAKGKVTIKPKSLSELTTADISELDAFHSEKVYMIEKPDDYFCGMRANHFVVEEGVSEFNESVNYLVSANHKGIRMLTLIEMVI